MNVKIIAPIIALVGLIVAVFLGSVIGNSTYLPILIGLGVLLFWCFFAFYGAGATPEAKLLAALIFGYTTFQRMFADIHFKQSIYIGELALGALLLLTMARVATRKGTIMPPISLTAPIVALLAIGTLRFLLVDVREYQILAARDFATVYYMLFYFIAYTAASQPISSTLIKKTFRYGVIFYIILIWVLRIISKSGKLYEIRIYLGTRDMAVIVPAIGGLLCILYGTYGKKRLWLLALSVVPIILLLVNLERSSYLAFGAGLFLLLYASSANLTVFSVKLLVATFLVAISVVGISIYSEMSHNYVFEPIVEKVTHIFDFDAVRSSHTAVAGSTDTSAEESNRWRTTWWRIVWRDTMANSPIFGLGFGYDLNRKFIREFYADRGGEETARNPHNILFTFLGRMGLLGATLFASFLILLFKRVFLIARAVRERQRPIMDLEPWLICLVIAIVALFSHTLEGPMASVPFWSFLGLAVAQEMRFRATDRGRIKKPTQALAPIHAHSLVSSNRFSV